MSIVPTIFNGMSGRKSINTISQIPEFGFEDGGITKPVIRLNYERTNNLANMNCMRQSVLKTNDGGSRGVNPCKGATSVGFAGGASRVLRRPNVPYEGGLYPQQGFARHQQRGLAYLKEKPINLPLMPIADSFNAGLNSRLGQPA